MRSNYLNNKVEGLNLVNGNGRRNSHLPYTRYKGSESRWCSRPPTTKGNDDVLMVLWRKLEDIALKLCNSYIQNIDLLYLFISQATPCNKVEKISLYPIQIKPLMYSILFILVLKKFISNYLILFVSEQGLLQSFWLMILSWAHKVTWFGVWSKNSERDESLNYYIKKLAS